MSSTRGALEPSSTADLGRKHSFTGPDGIPTYLGYRSASLSAMARRRRRLRSGLDSLAFEAVVIALVIIYAVVIFIDLTLSAINNPIDVDEAICSTTDEAERIRLKVRSQAGASALRSPLLPPPLLQLRLSPHHLRPLRTAPLAPPPPVQALTNRTIDEMCGAPPRIDVLYYLDLVFLCIFMVEILLRLAGYGMSYCRDMLQLLDMIVVIMAFALALIPEEVLTSLSFLNILRVVRLFRLAVVVSKLQVPSLHPDPAGTAHRKTECPCSHAAAAP